jgi:hypothetical protein
MSVQLRVDRPSSEHVQVGTWWVRSAGRAGFEVLAAGWRDWIFADVDRTGSRVVTLPHDGAGPFFVRAFPSLEVVRSVDPPPGKLWGFDGFFTGDLIVSTFRGGGEGLVAFSGHGQIEELDQPRAFGFSPADDGTWLETTGTTIRRRTMAHCGEGPAQMTLW